MLISKKHHVGEYLAALKEASVIVWSSDPWDPSEPASLLRQRLVLVLKSNLLCCGWEFFNCLFLLEDVLLWWSFVYVCLNMYVVLNPLIIKSIVNDKQEVYKQQEEGRGSFSSFIISTWLILNNKSCESNETRKEVKKRQTHRPERLKGLTW